jgi:WD40 repeat protein
VKRGVLVFLAAAALVLTARAAPITALVFSPDGTTLVSNGDRCVEIRSPKDASIQRKLACELLKITTLAFAPNGRVLAVGGGEPGVSGEVQLLTWPEGEVLYHFGDNTDLVTRIAFDTEGKRLAVAASDHAAKIWNLSQHHAPVLAFTLTGHAGPVLAIGFSPSAQSIVTTSADRSLKVWSSHDGRLLRTFSHHTEAIHALAFRPQLAGDTAPVTCASAGDDRTVRVWQPEIGRMVRIVRGHEGSIFALAWTNDGAALFSAGKEGIIRRIAADSDIIEAQRHAHTDWIYTLALSPDGHTLASGDWAGTVHLQDARRTLANGIESVP